MKNSQLDHPKRVRLALVEGKWDRLSFKPYLNRILGDKESIVAFWTTNGDITTRYIDEENERSTVSAKRNSDYEAITEMILNCVDEYMNYYKIEDRSLILEIIHVVDTDAVYVNNTRLKQIQRNMSLTTEETPKKLPLTTLDLSEGIVKCRSRKGAIKRNSMKRKRLDHLIDCGEIGGIPYRVFYMSSELEHVLHDVPNIKDEDKREKALEFACRFENNLTGFIEFIAESDFSVSGEYKETWSYLRDKDFDTRSMERHTNLGLLFTKRP